MDNPAVRYVITLAVMLIAVLAVWLVRRRWPHHELRENNEFIGFTWAFVGLVYGVYLAFTVVIVWEHFEQADDTAASEATHLSELWRDAAQLPGGQDVQAGLYAYVKSVVDHDWPAMAAGKPGAPETERLYEDVWQRYYRIRPGPTDVVHLAFYQASLAQLNAAGRERRMRILSGGANLPPIMWHLLIVGGAGMLLFALFIGAEKAWLQMILTAFLAGFLTYSVLIVGALAEPFSGDVCVKPDAFISVLRSFDARRADPPPPPVR
jgi:Protein of unknown function (DUF4239)